MRWVQWRRSLLFLLAPKSLCWTWRWRCHIWFQVSLLFLVFFNWFVFLSSFPLVAIYFETFCKIYNEVQTSGVIIYITFWYSCTIYTLQPVSIYLDTWHSHISHWSTSSACKAPTNKAWNVQCLFKLQQSLKCWMLILLKYINLQIYIL